MNPFWANLVSSNHKGGITWQMQHTIEFYDDQGAKIERGRENLRDVKVLLKRFPSNHEIRIPTDAQSGALTGTRKHEPMTFTKKFDKSSPYMYKAVCKGQTFKKVVIHWFEINDKGAETELLPA